MSETYGSRPFDIPRQIRQKIGRLLLGGSAIAFIVSVLAATTNIFFGFGLTQWQSWEVAGVLGGLAVPIAFSGVFLLLPATQTERRLAVAGSALSVLGVLLFWLNFPHQWHADPTDNSFLVVATYFIGIFPAFSALFFAVSNYEIPDRKTVVRHVTGVGRSFSETAPPEDMSQENTAPDTEPAATEEGGVGVLGNPETDVGDANDGVIVDDDDSPAQSLMDEYCGNCEHFEYQQTQDGDFQPVCTLHAEELEDMDACAEWSPPSRDSQQALS